MDEKICPIRHAYPNSDVPATDQPCIRERCAWWCDYVAETRQPGCCSILAIADYAGKKIRERGIF